MENKDENNVELLTENNTEESIETLEETKVESVPDVLVEENNIEVVNKEKPEESNPVADEKVEPTPKVTTDVNSEATNVPVSENNETNASGSATKVKVEGGKKKNNKLIIYGVIILVLIVVLVVFSLSNGNDDETTGAENNGNDVVEEEKNDSSNENVVEDLPNVASLDDYKTADALVELVKLPTYGDVDTEVYKNGGITFERMNDQYKFTLASQLIETENNYYTEQEMKEAFTNFFGKNTYEEVPNVIIGCAPYTYDANNKRYIADVEGCGGASAFSVNEKVLTSKEENDVYEIVTVVVYSSMDGYFKDVDTTKLISNADDFDIESYIKNNASALEQYTYSFAKEDGHYIYKGVTRTNNYQ